MQCAREVPSCISGSLLPLLLVSAELIFLTAFMSWRWNLINPSGHQIIIFPTSRLGYVFQLMIVYDVCSCHASDFLYLGWLSVPVSACSNDECRDV